MIPDVVIDVGNTRIKWGLCRDGRVVGSASLPTDEPGPWQKQFDAWQLAPNCRWVVADVHPARRGALVHWLEQHGHQVSLLQSAEQLTLKIDVEHPEKVGMDRLLNAVAANRVRRAGTPALIIDAGSAVTVDLVDQAGTFQGGAIMPGLQLMAQSLHQHTALLPLVDVKEPATILGRNTPAALSAGVFWSVIGGVEALVRKHRLLCPGRPDVFLTGGDAKLLATRLDIDAKLWPAMTLEGIRMTSEQMSAN